MCEFIPHYCELRIRNQIRARNRTLHVGAAQLEIKCGAGKKRQQEREWRYREVLTGSVPPGAVLCSVAPDSGLCISRPWGNNRDVGIWPGSSLQKPSTSNYYCSPSPRVPLPLYLLSKPPTYTFFFLRLSWADFLFRIFLRTRFRTCSSIWENEYKERGSQTRVGR